MTVPSCEVTVLMVLPRIVKTVVLIRAVWGAGHGSSWLRSAVPVAGDRITRAGRGRCACRRRPHYGPGATVSDRATYTEPGGDRDGPGRGPASLYAEGSAAVCRDHSRGD
ncbi:hypothetical protein Skr01_42360 [Sphaerisporangium krabiense]|nr:hypothetical protein Skr01_42360 [Sphaerisporangium krabiense]